MKRADRGVLALGLVALLVALSPASPATESAGSPAHGGAESPARLKPRDRAAIGRYFVQIDSPSVSDLTLTAIDAEADPRLVAATQASAIAQVTASGGEVVFRYTRLLNGFSATMPALLAAEIAARRDVISVEPVGVMKRTNSSSVPFIGAKKVWRRYGVSGEGMKVAVIDTGIDYSHKGLGGAGTRAAFNANDPTFIEPGSFPTKKVTDGYDFVGASYDVLDGDTSNDSPEPDPDPLDDNGHGTHVAGTCCGKGVPGKVGRGVAFKARILAYKVWGQGGSSSADVLVAAYERAVDPNEDGDFSDAPDVLSFSGAVPYGSSAALESQAAERVVELGIVFVAGAGNSGHQTTDGQAYVLGAPASTSGVIAVAASSDPDDGIASFSSQGPARGSHLLKPDVTAPGVDIHSANRGSGDEGRFVSGTSMATPHVSGVAALLLQLHPNWSPAQVKAAIMNHAKPQLFENGRSEVPATVKGAGRVRASLAARAVSFAIPSSLSFGVAELTSPAATEERTLTLSNNDDRQHRYDLIANVSYSDYGYSVVRPQLSVNGAPFSARGEVTIASNDSAEVAVRLDIDPRLITRAEQELRFYEFLPGVDGGIEIHQDGGAQDDLRVPWHVIPLAASDNAADATSLDLSAGADEISFPSEAAGRSAADLYVLGATDPPGGDFGEEDVVAMGARSFTGASLTGGAVGLPPRSDPARDRTWLDVLDGTGEIEEPIEFAFAMAEPHETLRTMRITIYIDRGADGIFDDPGSDSDYTLTKKTGNLGVCATEDAGQGCDALLRPSFHQYDTELIGIVADARAMGLTDAKSLFAYRAEICTDRFTGDAPQPECDLIGFGGGGGGGYVARLDPLTPPLVFSRSFCGNFWSRASCAAPIGVSPGETYDGDPLLTLYQNNAVGEQFEAISTTGP